MHWKVFDKSGKWTQSNLLVEKLNELGFKAIRSEFHRYDTPTGKLIRDWLTKKYDVSQKTIELIIAADKQAQMDYFKILKNQGYDYLVLDRYIGSQIAYGVASESSIEWLQQLQTYTVKPDIEILIDICESESYIRKGKFEHNDRYEEDMKYLKKVRQVYLDMFNNRYILYSCKRTVVDGKLEKQVIANEIIKRIKIFENIL